MAKFSLLPNSMVPKFPLGNFVITAEAFRKLPVEDVSAALGRHSQGDWGEICSPDWEANNKALDSGGQLLSVFHDSNDVRFWIITEADHKTTTVLLPHDY